MKSDFKVEKKVTIMFLISSLIIMIISNLNISGYLKLFVIPFIFMLLNYLILLKNKCLNKKNYLLLIPIILILISGFIKIDWTNKVINVLILPILYGVLFTLLINKNFYINGSYPLWIFKYFPNKLFSNLKYLKEKNKVDAKSKIPKVIIGILISFPIAGIILFLLMDADIYFRNFIIGIQSFIYYDFSFIKNIILFVLSFIILFSVYINIINVKDDKMSEKKYSDYDKTIFQTVLIIINIIYTLFLISEVSRLTTNFLSLPQRYTYSSYAREGFFELLFVTLINFAIVIFMMYKTKAVKENKIIKSLLISLSVFSILLIFNSYYRMFLYINHYSFTVLRLQVILFLLMELIIFIILTIRMIKEVKAKDALIYFVIMITFYVLNLYLCNNYVIHFLNKILR